MSIAVEIRANQLGVEDVSAPAKMRDPEALPGSEAERRLGELHALARGATNLAANGSTRSLAQR
ncbi:hypothetical protein [Caulobacter sp.]|uniref:hypothetical protein n=1 Tax=Caulobacter sp. TaxID=78 RepID=UPI003BAEFE07